MRVLFDTSVLIAGFVSSHPKHHAALEWLQRAKAKEVNVVVSSHSLAESFAVLTRLPLSPRITPDVANYLLRENVVNLARIIALSTQDYLAVIKDMTELGCTGGIIYDAITVKAAKKAKVDKIMTLNVKDFERLTPHQQSYIISP